MRFAPLRTMPIAPRIQRKAAPSIGKAGDSDLRTLGLLFIPDIIFRRFAGMVYG